MNALGADCETEDAAWPGIHRAGNARRDGRAAFAESPVQDRVGTEPFEQLDLDRHRPAGGELDVFRPEADDHGTAGSARAVGRKQSAVDRAAALGNSAVEGV